MTNKSVDNKKIGFLSVLALVVGTMVGVGILITPSLMYKFGKFGFIAWPIASMLCLGLAVMFGRLSGMVNASGPAGFAHAAFGNLASFQVTWAHWIGFTAAQGIITYSFGQYTAPAFASIFGQTILGHDISIFVSLIGLWLITFLSVFVTIFSVSSVLVLTTIKVSLLSIIIIAGLPYLSISKVLSYQPIATGSTEGLLMAAISICLLSFIGLETATLPSDNVKNPKITIPLATVIGTSVAALLYTVSYAVVGSIFDQQALANTTKPMYDATRFLLGEYGGYALILCAGLGFFASINGILFGQSYMLKYASEIKILPKIFKKTSSAGFPTYAAFFSASISTILTLMIYHDTNWTPILGAFSSCFVSIAYLWSVISFRHLGGSIVLWAINFATALCFLSGSLEAHLIPKAILLYCASFFIYGLCVTNKKLEYIN